MLSKQPKEYSYFLNNYRELLLCTLIYQNTLLLISFNILTWKMLWINTGYADTLLYAPLPPIKVIHPWSQRKCDSGLGNSSAHTHSKSAVSLRSWTAENTLCRLIRPSMVAVSGEVARTVPEGNSQHSQHTRRGTQIDLVQWHYTINPWKVGWHAVMTHDGRLMSEAKLKALTYPILIITTITPPFMC